jgi:putative membrane protein
MSEKPVYLFTGFLGSGKTTFIQDTLSTPEFGEGEATLLLVCEEGEVEFDESKFADTVYMEVIEDESDLTEAHLNGIASRYDFDRVLIEYNGMWMTQSLFGNMPRNWVIAQEITFFDATTFLMYNQNMRQLCFNKMQTAELCVFNRCTKGFDKMPFHKEVRIANRKSQILYEYGPYDVEPDNIPDPLPYDKEADEIEIKDEWYAEWYRDINENQDDYDGKTLLLKGRAVLAPEFAEGRFAFGRHVMTCCVQDIQFAGLMAVWDDAASLETGEWVTIRAHVKVEFDENYGEVGPVLWCEEVRPCDPCDPEVATF